MLPHDKEMWICFTSLEPMKVKELKDSKCPWNWIWMTLINWKKNNLGPYVSHLHFGCRLWSVSLSMVMWLCYSNESPHSISPVTKPTQTKMHCADYDWLMKLIGLGITLISDNINKIYRSTVVLYFSWQT